VASPRGKNREIIADIIGITDILNQNTGTLSILKTDIDHHYSLGLYMSTNVLYKLNET